MTNTFTLRLQRARLISAGNCLPPRAKWPASTATIAMQDGEVVGVYDDRGIREPPRIEPDEKLAPEEDAELAVAHAPGPEPGGASMREAKPMAVGNRRRAVKGMYVHRRRTSDRIIL